MKCGKIKKNGHRFQFAINLEWSTSWLVRDNKSSKHQM